MRKLRPLVVLGAALASNLMAYYTETGLDLRGLPLVALWAMAGSSRTVCRVTIVANPVERREVHFTGHVQGVGFRYSTRNVAEQFQVTGYVRNLSDGRVELIVEGDAAELDGFLAGVEQKMRRYLRDVQVNRTSATGQFTGFEIRF